MSKPILCLDFDGVIHSYENGWQDGVIYGKTLPGFWTWLDEAVKVFDVHIYSSRSKTPEGIEAMAEWLGTQSIENGLKELGADYDWAQIFGEIKFSAEKPPAFLTIDDRAIRFEGDWSALPAQSLLSFKPWSYYAKG